MSPPTDAVDSGATHYDEPPADPDGTFYTTAPESGQPQTSLPLKQIGNYEILGELARGGMGVVYRSREIRTGRAVALKMILAGQFATADSIARFNAEARAAANLDHPGIVPIYEVGELDGKPYFTMPLITGGSLNDLLRDGPLPPEVAARLVQKVADAVQYAHDKGVIHRDIKPHNILLQREELLVGKTADAGATTVHSSSTSGSSYVGPTPRLTDFGLARAVESEGGMTASGEAMGTPSYMPPEQAAGQLKLIGVRSDVYSLGAVLYCLLTGRPPFQSASAYETMRQVREQEPASPRQLNQGVPRDLETVCLKCLAKEPGRRYPTAAELSAELGRFLAGQPVQARAVGVLERGWRWCGRNRTVASLGAAVIVILIAATGVSSSLAVRAMQAQERAQKAEHERALAQVEGLLDANPQAVPAIVKGLEPFRSVVDPHLREMVQRPDLGEDQRARIRLALLPIDDSQIAPLRERMLEAEPEEVVLIRDGLAPYADALKADLWIEAVQGKVLERRAHAVVALALFDPENERWKRAAEHVIDHFLEANPIYFGVWTKALRPVRSHLIGPLVRAFHDEKAGDKRLVAASVLADYAADRPELLIELLQDAEPRQFAVLWPKLQPHRRRLIAEMTAELAKTPQVDADEAAKNTLARRQAQAAVALLRSGAADRVWPLFQHLPDPRLRSYLIHQVKPLGVDPTALVDRYERETNVSAKRALLLAVGEFGDAVPLPPDCPFLAQLLQDYRDHPDPGLHSAVDWLLRQRHGRDADLAAIDRDLRGKPAEQRQWYVNGQGQTLALIRGPVVFDMGSPTSEPERFDNEQLHRQRIGRSFAIGTRKVTVEQFQRFLKAHPEVEHKYSKRYSPDPDGPIISVLWYEAAQYCRWLSEQEGVPEKEMCYPPHAEIKEGMKFPANYLSRTGYRLPTEAEWEYACRAGAVTAHYYGEDERLLDKYGWYIKNANNRAWPLGRLKPNDFGLFDAHGNVFDWVTDRDLPYPSGVEGGAVEDDDEPPISNNANRILRGGSFLNDPFLRSAARFTSQPSTRMAIFGMRVAQTVR